MIKVCVCTHVCTRERGGICVHINIWSPCLFNSPLRHFKNKSRLCFKGENVMHGCVTVRQRIMI